MTEIVPDFRAYCKQDKPPSYNDLGQITPSNYPHECAKSRNRYPSAGKGNFDIYVVFAEKGLVLLNDRGLLGYILPHKFFNAQYGEPLRGLIAKGQHLSHVVHFGHQQLFPGATTYTCLVFLDRGGAGSVTFARVDDMPSWRASGSAVEGKIPASDVTSAEWNFTVGRDSSLVHKMRAAPVKLGDVADIFVGLQTSADDVYILELEKDDGASLTLKSHVLGEPLVLERQLVHPLVSGTDVGRYEPLPHRQYILFPYVVENADARLMPMKQIEKEFPRVASYLAKCEERLRGREHGKFNDDKWHRFGRNQNLGIQGRLKLCVPRLVEQLHAAFDAAGSFFLDNVDVGGVTLRPRYERQGLPYVMGLLNSSLMRWYFPHVSAPFRGGWMSANRQFLSQLPIRTIDFKSSTEVTLHDKMIALVERMLKLHVDLRGAWADCDKDAINRNIEATDNEIDALVYELYGLTKDEIAIVKGRAM